ncbi:hypothetical protein GMOD_00007052 [Pyrenophora seminiperda CCB06]|uniref:Uncharacterized protein n=1 Tax=Pyrenophora seminiperda CCB06 TaxID=1302712 RepID=A0A3M7MC33_9PLEO|nr:hypothetical protein GMOD_00007052 [Pyrenophora seminiperda CCB06]
MTSDLLFACGTLIFTAVFGWWRGWSWPWQKAQRREWLSDVEMGIKAVDRKEVKDLERKLAVEEAMRANDEERHRKVVGRLEERNGDLEAEISRLLKELDEAKARPGVPVVVGGEVEVGVEVVGPSTVRKRIPS